MGFTTDWTGYFTGYGTISFSSDVPALATTTPNYLTAGWVTNDGGGWAYGSVSININSTNYTGGGFPTNGWNTGSDMDRTTILLHELAHAISLLQPGDVNGFGAPDGNPLDPKQRAQQLKNQQAINDDCINPLMKLRGQ